jgi:hypothetical protein
MTTLKFWLRLASFAATLALATGCSGASTPAPAAGVQPAASWMAPDAKKSALLYVSDLGTNDVYVLSYPKGKLEGTISGFGAVHGGCVDAQSDVFITDGHDSKIEEFAHGGTTPIATLDDTGYGPVGCSIDPKTGDLAVANISPVYGSTSGNIAIYKNASGTGKFYTDSSVYLYYDCSYDGKGNLYVSGSDMNGNFKLAELPRNGTTFTNIAVHQQIYVPGGVKWDGKYLAVEDQGAGYRGSTIYRFSVSGSSATKVGATSLSGSSDVLQFSIYHHRVIGGNIGSSPNVMYWQYPSGTATKTLTGFTEPDGVAVSPGV